jgi:hypothetical protein
VKGCLVNPVEDWEVLEEYAGDKQGFYQVLGDAEAVEIRTLPLLYSPNACSFL